ncbi:hypothetical protein LTR56_020752 [Elasticomyces elasticus]|nr:hypothetical protein LTR22_025467 [Elasticomyces elasticus]KAK3624855.1 hypothetical protein LTR56_020752 [Elasticomyces elasticus]
MPDPVETDKQEQQEEPTQLDIEEMDAEPTPILPTPSLQQYAGSKRTRHELDEGEGHEAKFQRALAVMEQLLQEEDEDWDEPVHWALAGIVTGTDGRIPIPRNY